MDTHGAHGCHNPAQGKAHTSETCRHARPHGGGGGGGFLLHTIEQTERIPAAGLPIRVLCDSLHSRQRDRTPPREMVHMAVLRPGHRSTAGIHSIIHIPAARAAAGRASLVRMDCPGRASGSRNSMDDKPPQPGRTPAAHRMVAISGIYRLRDAPPCSIRAATET